MAQLREIPVFDARNGGPVEHAQARIEAMRDLLHSCLGSLPPAAQGAVAGLDAGARQWFAASGSPYAAEIENIAALLPEKGVFLINAAYEWGCTTLAAPAPGGASVRLLRTLDWDFDGLGRRVEVVRQRGKAGEYLNVTWPGAVGVLTALAPGRFAAAINKAPQPLPDRAAQANIEGMPNLAALRIGALPSMHLLRRVFDEAADFSVARTLLERTPIAATTIFTLVGTRLDETCVIERRPDDFVTHHGMSTAANTWNYAGWENDDEEPGDSAERRSCIARFAGMAMAPFAWVEPPLRNPITRLAVEADPKLGTLRVRGYEATPDDLDSVAVTTDLEIG